MISVANVSKLLIASK